MEYRTLDAALQYIVNSCGEASLKQKGMVISMLSDILHENQKAQRLMKQIYLISEAELSEFVNAAISQKNVDRAISKLLASWKYAAMDESYMEQAANALVKAYGLDEKQLLGSVSYELPRKYHRDKLIALLKELYQKGILDTWTHMGDFLSAIEKGDEKLKAELKLFGIISLFAEKEFMGLVKNAASHKDDTYKMDVAVFQNALRDAFMDLETIDWVVECLLISLGKEYTQNIIPKQASSNLQNTNSRRRSSSPNTNSGKRSSSQNNVTGTQASTQVSASAVSSKPIRRKKKSSLGRIALIMIVLLVVYKGLPIIQEKNDDKNAVQETQESAVVPSPSAEATPKPVKQDPYPAPKLSTAANQGGLYLENLIYIDRNYATYSAPDFSFGYPRILYNSVAYTFENEGEDVDIYFTCQSDPSILTVTRHPNDGSVTAEDYIQEIKDSVKACQVLNERKSLKGGHMIRVKGKDMEDSSLVVYHLVQMTDSYIMEMIIKYPTPTDTENQARKEFYAETMYDYCSFGGDQKPETWSEFKKSYGL